MIAWAERTKEEAHLLNPAFCCAVMTSSVEGYQTISEKGMPIPLIHFILPIILHEKTRSLMPSVITSSLPVWIQENSFVRILFPQRVISLKPFTHEALLFGVKHGWLKANGDARILSTRTKANLKKATKNLGKEPIECINRANFLGRWLASAGSPQTVMALWGVKP